MKIFGMSFSDLYTLVVGTVGLLLCLRSFLWVTRKLKEETEEARRKEHEASKIL